MPERKRRAGAAPSALPEVSLHPAGTSPPLAMTWTVRIAFKRFTPPEDKKWPGRGEPEGFADPSTSPSDRHDGNSSHPGSQGPEITRVSGQQTNATVTPTREGADDRVDGVVPHGATQP